jgi:alanine racemase
VKSLCPGAKISGVVKADGYGHGVGHVLEAVGEMVDGFAVASLGEAIELRKVGFKGEIWVFSGILLDEEVSVFQQQKLTPVVHNANQLRLAQSRGFDLPLILKVDTGMGRLGFKPQTARKIIESLIMNGSLAVVMGHFSHADVRGSEITRQQLNSFLSIEEPEEFERSIAASAGILSGVGTNLSWVRPGLALYGVSPFQDSVGQEHGLIPAMTLQSRLIAVRMFDRGDSLGYGGEWICPETMPVGFVGCGYGDGYPRSISVGTCIVMRGKKVPIIGRISMDSMAVDLRGINDAKLGEPVILWGDGLPIEGIARAANTIPNEILSRLPHRVDRIAEV